MANCRPDSVTVYTSWHWLAVRNPSFPPSPSPQFFETQVRSQFQAALRPHRHPRPSGCTESLGLSGLPMACRQLRSETIAMYSALNTLLIHVTEVGRGNTEPEYLTFVQRGLHGLGTGLQHFCRVIRVHTATNGSGLLRRNRTTCSSRRRDAEGRRASG